jgi:hypothetical protein
VHRQNIPDAFGDHGGEPKICRAEVTVTQLAQLKYDSQQNQKASSGHRQHRVRNPSLRGKSPIRLRHCLLSGMKCVAVHAERLNAARRRVLEKSANSRWLPANGGGAGTRRNSLILRLDQFASIRFQLRSSGTD